ncbi:MAG TPA: type III pantothenate kinase [Chloroflexota bacterium]|nr:type III pantothenate kinase [Chloroflexota bacterium]
MTGGQHVESLLLAVDVGNTNVTIGIFDGAELRDSWRISTDRRRMADEYRPLVAELLRGSGLGFGDVRAAVFASVVPPVIAAMSEAFEKEHLKVMALSALMDFGIRVRYDPPSSVGADRLANAIAVDELYGRPAIIVDLGTATTLDVLNGDGEYIGGAIAPGIESSMEGLFSHAFQLPRLQLEAPPSAIGRTTVESIRSGAILGWASLVDGLVDRFKSEMAGTPHVIATGGLASLVAPHCRTVSATNLDLTLVGLRLAYERVAGAK